MSCRYYGKSHVIYQRIGQLADQLGNECAVIQDAFSPCRLEPHPDERTCPLAQAETAKKAPNWNGVHEWSRICEDAAHAVDTCTKCGVLRLKTLSATFYFVQFDEKHSACWRQYGKEEKINDVQSMQTGTANQD